MYEPTIEEILDMKGMEDVKAELEDPRFGNRQHGSRATAALNCDGPLCRLAERDRSRRRNQLKAEREGREYKAYGRTYDRDDLLAAIVKWHKIQLYKRRIEELSAS